MSVLVVHTYGLQERIGENMRIKIKGYGTIQASKDTLNLLSCALDKASELEGKKGHKAFGNTFSNMSDDIYTALKAVGYYDKK